MAGTPGREQDTPVGSTDQWGNTYAGAGAQGEKLNCEAAARAASTPWPGALRLGQLFRDILDGTRYWLCVHTD